jgi:cysteine desulfurase / selenocysteine lyase
MISEHDVTRLRAETKGAKSVVHFNNAGASLPPDAVHNRVIAHLEREREIGGYEAKAEAAEEFENFYPTLAKLIGAKPAEIAFVENATRAWDMAFYSLPIGEGDEIITVEAEYASNYLAFLQVAKSRGVVIKVAQSDVHGQADVAHIEKLISSRTKLIAITHVPSQGGLINPAEEIGRIARAHGILYLLDACQSVGQLEIDVAKIGCDMLSATGRKFLRGPRGTGFLYMKEELANRIEPVMIDLHAATWTSATHFELAPGARRFENWECYYAGKLGLAEAARYAMEIGLDKIAARNQHLSGLLRRRLSEVANVSVTDLGVNRSAIVTFAVRGKDATAIHADLKQRRINTSVSPASYAQLDLPKRGHAELVRASVHYFNTDNEIEDFILALKVIISN